MLPATDAGGVVQSVPFPGCQSFISKLSTFILIKLHLCWPGKGRKTVLLFKQQYGSSDTCFLWPKNNVQCQYVTQFTLKIIPV